VWTVFPNASMSGPSISGFLLRLALIESIFQFFRSAEHFIFKMK
jgi:hypothetical protein